MRRRNILALLMAAALCLCLLAGCGSAETTDSTGTSIAEATTIADLKGMKIAAQAGTFHADALNQIENVQGSTYPEFADLRLHRRGTDGLLRLPERRYSYVPPVYEQ